MKPFRSIRWRLQLWYGLLIAALLTAGGATAYHFARSVRLERVDDELQRLVFAVNATNRRPLPPAAPGEPPRRPARAAAALADVFTAQHLERGFYFALWTRNFTPFTASPNAPASIPQPRDGPPDLRWRGPLREAFIGSNPGDISLVGRDLSAELAELHALGWKIAAGGVGVLGVTLLIGSWLVARALRPIRDIGATAQKIATGDLSQRINTRDTDSELGELAGVLNSTFSRLESAFTQQARFTADAAHELRTPISVILTHTQNALADDTLTADQREPLEATQRAAQRMRRLIESLLRLARLDAGQEAREQAGLDVAEVARECLELVQPLAATRSITVHAELGAALSRGDREGFSQVVTNLLANAVHHNREGGEIRIDTHTEAGRAVLTVADNGPGIPPEHLPHVFERFYRADKARTAQLGRTGLGLAIAQAIVHAHGGEIEARSEPGKGATFIVRLPAVG